MAETGAQHAVELARRGGILTAREAAVHGIHSQVLTRLVAGGTFERVSPGVYWLREAPVTEHHGLALVAAAAPGSVICLLSALAFHDVGTQAPAEVWVAVERRARPPVLGEWPPVRVVRFGGDAFAEGAESHRIEGVAVKVYSVAKTVADLFKYRNKIGLDVALEALREAWSDRRATVDELMHYARVCRVERVMRPYLEATVA